MMTNRRAMLLGSMLFAMSVAVLGCHQEQAKVDQQAKASTDPAKKPPVPTGMDSNTGQLKRKTEIEHDEFWCGVHGIPEEECGKCNKAIRDKAKLDGDWCEVHTPNRMKSQCFACDPTLYERVFEPKYTAKYPGWLPARPPEKEFK